MLLGTAALLLTTNLAEHTIVAGGDVSLARHAHLSLDDPARSRWLAPFAGTFRDADLAMVNLECVVSTKGRFHRKPESRPYFYRARPEMLDALTSIGVDLVSIANNHAMDYGPDALTEELELLEAAGIDAVGGGRNLAEAMRPVYVRVGDVVLAWFAVDASLPTQRTFAAGERSAGTVVGDMRTDDLVEMLRPGIQEARRHAHIVVFTPHWGSNWTDGPDEDLKRLAHAFVDAGVDLILGHSSHQFHGVEVHRGKLIVYDMGSILFDRVGQRRMSKGLLHRVRFDAGGVRQLELFPVRLVTNATRAVGAREAESYRELFRRLTRELDPDLEVRDGDDGWLVVPVPHGGEPRAIAPPTDARPTGRTRRLPRALRMRRPDVFVDELPAALRDNVPVDLGGIEYLGALLPSTVPARHDVIVELFLRAKEPPRARRTLVISGEERGSECRHGEWAEPGDWALPTSRWKPGEIVRHRVALRSPATCGAGIFDIEVELRDPKGPPSATKAKIGSFRAVTARRPNLRLVEPTVAFAAGRPMPRVAPAPSEQPERLPWVAGAVVALLLVAVAVFFWRRSRRAGTGTNPPAPPVG